MNSDIKRLHRVCFSGHRPEKLLSEYCNIAEIEEEIKNLLRPVISKSIEDGYTSFITGMARGFDVWAADVVLEEKEKSPSIRLICAIPFLGFDKKRSHTEQLHYRYILRKSDYVQVVSPFYNPSCFQKRNKFMVDNSSRLISAYNGSGGGTYNTIAYANSKDLEVINILSHR